MAEPEKLIEGSDIQVNLVQCDKYYKFIKEVCRVVRDAIDTVFKDEIARKVLYIREDDELVTDSKAIRHCIIVFDRAAPDFLDTSFGKIKFSRRSRLRLHDNGLLTAGEPMPPTEDTPAEATPAEAKSVIFYNTENIKPFLRVRDSVLRQLQTEHWNIVGPEKKVLGVNHLEIPEIPHLWELPWEERIKLWEKFKNMHRSTTPPREKKKEE
jgi:hypothetical protein